MSFRDSGFEPHDSLDPQSSPVMAFHKGKLVTKADGSSFHILAELEGVASGDTLFVGKFEGVAHFTLELQELPDAHEPVHLRDYLDQSTDTFARASRALQFITWDKAHRYCGACGTATERGDSEWVRLCPACGHRSYPRLSPCVIMAIRKGEEILLAQRPNGLTNRYTVLAGFVEPGESAEHAVRREVFEESQLEIQNLRYLESQPWPFPGQLMLGYLADYASGELVADETELLNANWYHYRDLPDYPGMNTIAGRLINRTIAEIEGKA